MWLPSVLCNCDRVVAVDDVVNVIVCDVDVVNVIVSFSTAVEDVVVAAAVDVIASLIFLLGSLLVFMTLSPKFIKI